MLFNRVSFYIRMYLKDLIETNHVFMKLLEHLGKKQRNLIVLCKSKKKKKSSKSNYEICDILFCVSNVQFQLFFLRDCYNPPSFS